MRRSKEEEDDTKAWPEAEAFVSHTYRNVLSSEIAVLLYQHHGVTLLDHEVRAVLDEALGRLGAVEPPCPYCSPLQYCEACSERLGIEIL
jgi:hypothetical protein